MVELQKPTFINGEAPDTPEVLAAPVESELQQDTNALMAAMEAINELGVTPEGMRKFMDSEHAVNVWLKQADGTWTRGTPGKMPYEVIKQPPHVHDPVSDAYWNTYGLRRRAPVIESN